MDESPISISPEETEELFDKLKALADELTEPQQALLEAILRIARDITEIGEEDEEGVFDGQFAEAFTPFPAATVGAVLGYAVYPPVGGSIIRHSASAPASIIRTTPTHHP